jgi:magnesium transporter
MASDKGQGSTPPEQLGAAGYTTLWFSRLLGMPVCAGKIGDRIGRVTDLVFSLSDPYPESVGIYLEHGWGKPTQFIPWDRVVKVDEDAVFVQPPPQGGRYQPFVDQPGWILLEQGLMGKTMIDIDGRRTEVVNDIQLLEAKGRLVLIHVDISFNGFLRRWGLGWLRLIPDRLVSWKYVQPLSVEDAGPPGKVTLSITKKQIHELPGEDLADALEELSGDEQEALFSALDSEKAAEALVEAEPRAQRQIIASLRRERARNILTELSVPQLVGLLSVLPHDDKEELLAIMPPEQGARVKGLLSEREATARGLIGTEFLTFPGSARVRDVLEVVRKSGLEAASISYLYVTSGGGQVLAGVVDMRELLLAQDDQTLEDIMASPVVTAEADDLVDDLEELFIKYHYRMVPVVDRSDRILGVIHYNDIMKSPDAKARG